MKRVIAILEFDDDDLGEQWLNADNLKALLYSEHHTHESFLKLISYIDMPAEKRIELHGKLTELVCEYCPTNAAGCIGLKCTVSNADLDVIVSKVFTHLDNHNNDVADNPNSEG